MDVVPPEPAARSGAGRCTSDSAGQIRPVPHGNRAGTSRTAGEVRPVPHGNRAGTSRTQFGGTRSHGYSGFSFTAPDGICSHERASVSVLGNCAILAYPDYPDSSACSTNNDAE